LNKDQNKLHQNNKTRQNKFCCFCFYLKAKKCAIKQKINTKQPLIYIYINPNKEDVMFFIDGGSFFRVISVNTSGDVLASQGEQGGEIPHCLATKEARRLVASTTGSATPCLCGKHYVLVQKHGDVINIYVGMR